MQQRIMAQSRTHRNTQRRTICALCVVTSSKALSVHDGGARLIIFSLRDPHLLEGTERGQDGATNPDRVLALWRRDDLDLHRGRSQSGELLSHALADALEHGGATRE